MTSSRSFRCSQVTRLLVVFVSLCWATACMPDIEQDEDPGPPRVQPVLDSEAETLPLPNTLALDEQGTLPDLEGAGEMSAQGEFLSWLSTLHGWLPETDIEVFFNGRLDEETITPEAFDLYRVTDEGAESLEIAALNYRERTVQVTGPTGELQEVEGSVVTIVPAEPLEPQTEYGAVVTKQIEGADGRAIQEPQAIFFAASQQPLVDDNGRSEIEVLSDEQAQQLEELRQLLQPLFDVAANQGISRDQVAMAFRWHTVRDPMTILDPATQTLPLPNTAALEEDGTFPAESALDNVGGEDAQGYFNAYLDDLHGWPPTTPITLPVRGELNAETVSTDNVQLWAMSSDGTEAEQISLSEVTYDADSGTVTLVPESPLPTRRRFVAFATSGVENAEGLSLKLPAALRLAIQPHPVLEDDMSTVAQVSDQEAQSIAALQQFMQPAATFLEEEANTSPDELGAIWTWETWMDTFAVFDPEAGELPMPNEFVRQGEDGSVTLPTEGLSEVQQQLVQELNTRFGFSTTAAGWIPFDGPIDPETLDDQSLQFLWIEPPVKVYDPARYNVEYRADWSRVTYTPLIPWHRDPNLEPNPDPALPQNVGVVTQELMGGNGHPVQPSPAFVFLRSPHPLVDDQGQSTVEQLDDQTAQQLESARQTFAQLLALGLAAEDVSAESREDLALAWAFHPQNTPQTLQQYRAQAMAKLDERGTLEVTQACQQTPCTPENAPPMPNVGQVYWGSEFETVEFLADDGTLRSFDDAQPASVGVSIFLPQESACDGPPFEVALIEHGLGSSRLAAGQVLADPLAAECVATVAMDLPGHGGRTPGVSGLHPTSTPDQSGAMFFTLDLRASLNRMVQGIVDMAVLARIIESGGLEAAIDDPTTDWIAEQNETGLGYLGHSLGGFMGYPLETIDPNYEVGVFANTGGKLSRVLTEGALGMQLNQALPEQGTFEFFRARAFAQWLADIVDPFAFSPWIAESPPFPADEALRVLTYEPESGEFSKGAELEPNEVLLQMTQDQESMDDPVVPNATTELLANATGVSLENSTFTGGHSLLFENGDNAEAQCMRQQAATWIASGLEGEAMLIEPPCQ